GSPGFSDAAVSNELFVTRYSLIPDIQHFRIYTALALSSSPTPNAICHIVCIKSLLHCYISKLLHFQIATFSN
ncbi:MAG: hypothetical protein RQ735_11605, partial [Flavobacteriaceae bacterium]|nr:hypothetical protein [Flavobacteriaceae bacterium]